MTIPAPAVPRCESGHLVYRDGHLADIIYCREPGTETRPRKVRVPASAANPTGRIPGVWRFCRVHAARHDLFSARLKVASLRYCEERGEAFMTDCGHTRPVLTAEETAALATDHTAAAA